MLGKVADGVVVVMSCDSKIDAHMLSRGITSLHYMMEETNVGVEKRVIVCFMQLYRLALLVTSPHWHCPCFIIS